MPCRFASTMTRSNACNSKYRRVRSGTDGAECGSLIPGRRVRRNVQERLAGHCSRHRWMPRSCKPWAPSWHPLGTLPSPLACWSPPQPDPSASRSSNHSRRMLCRPWWTESRSFPQSSSQALSHGCSDPRPGLQKTCTRGQHKMQGQELGTELHCLPASSSELEQELLTPTAEQGKAATAPRNYRGVFTLHFVSR